MAGLEGLSIKQRLFVEEYLKCLNGVEAARRAGYKGSYSVLGVTAHDNLKNPKIRALVDERIKDACLSTDEALAILAAHASFDPGPYLIIEKDKDPALDLQRLKDVGLTGAIKSIAPTANGIKIEFESRQGAIDKILRAQGAYQDRVDVTSGDEPIADVRTEILSALSSIAKASAEKNDS